MIVRTYTLDRTLLHTYENIINIHITNHTCSIMTKDDWELLNTKEVIFEIEEELKDG